MSRDWAKTAQPGTAYAVLGDYNQAAQLGNAALSPEVFKGLTSAVNEYEEVVSETSRLTFEVLHSLGINSPDSQSAEKIPEILGHSDIIRSRNRQLRSSNYVLEEILNHIRS